MERQYSICITRWNNNDEGEVLEDRYITADEVIDFMLTLGQKDHIVEADDMVVDKAEETEPEPKKKAGRQTSYDKAEMMRDLKLGTLSVAEIADKHGVIKQTVYNVRNRMKKNGEVTVEAAEAPATMNDELAQCQSNECKVQVMHKHGMSQQDIYNRMHDYMTDSEIREALESVQQ